MKLKEISNFIQLWGKFREICKVATRKVITPQEEAEFSQTKEIVLKRYEALVEILKKSLDTDPILEILNASSMSSISDKDQARQQANWVNASILLKSWRRELLSRPQGRRFIKFFGRG